jgi:hypothetical protein
MGSLALSYSDDFEGYYKIAGFTLFRNEDRIKISRETYDFLTMIGDVGGLFDGLYLIGLMIINLLIVRKWNITAYMMQYLYKSERDKNGNYNFLEQEEHNITADGLRKGKTYSFS